MTKPINGKDCFITDKCEHCGHVAYSVIERCPVCGNTILVSKELDEQTWRSQKAANWKKGVKQIIDSPVWQAERRDNKR